MAHPQTEDEESVQDAASEESAPAEEAIAQKVEDALVEEVAALKDQLLRAVAESENIRRRAQRDLEDARKYAVSGFARELVGVTENLQRALESVPPEAREKDEFLKTLTEGVQITQQELLSIFEKAGIRRIDPLGQKFDHNFHQAVVQIVDPDNEPGTVVQVIQAGYVIHDRLLRPAMVGVAK
ncbi:MAG: nucleotide exchange factor GrpE [Alphaproteobacteria bacterium]|nr:nucleotide exchange factor GrpE [Alphaproteobacteria bacterium]